MRGRLLFSLLTVTLALGTRPAWTDDKPTAPPPAPAAPAPSPDVVARTNALKTRATEWLTARTKLRRELCYKCRGFGVVVDNATRQRVSCPTCMGNKTLIPKDPYRIVNYEMRSVAWRRRPTAQDEANEGWKVVRLQATAPGYLVKYRFDRVELLGAAGGRVWVFEGTDSVSRESNWIVVGDPTKSASWSLHSPLTDGPWPPVGTVEAGAPETPLAPEAYDALRAKLGLADVRHGVVAAAMADSVLVLRVSCPKARSTADLDAAVAADVRSLVEKSMEAVPSASSVRIVFMARWRDDLGSVEQAPYKIAQIARDKFEKIHFERLEGDEKLLPFGLVAADPPKNSILWWKD
jgi:hypothetical protein